MNYDPKQLEKGTSVEHEHTKDDALARKIATDHLKEDPRYYDKLMAAGLEEEDMEEGALTPTEAGMTETGNVVAPAVVDKVVAVAVAPTKQQKPLTSSGLGKGGVNKPLTSANSTAPETSVVKDKNTAIYNNTPNNPTFSSADPVDHFCGQVNRALTNLAEGGASIKKK